MRDQTQDKSEGIENREGYPVTTSPAEPPETGTVDGQRETEEIRRCKGGQQEDKEVEEKDYKRQPEKGGKGRSQEEVNRDNPQIMAPTVRIPNPFNGSKV